MSVMAEDADVAILRAIIGVQHAINDADPTADAVMKIVVNEARSATGARPPWWNSPKATKWCTRRHPARRAVPRVAAEPPRQSVGSGCAGRQGAYLPRLRDRRPGGPRSLPPSPCPLDGRRALATRESDPRVLKVMSDQPHAFTDHHIHLLEQLATFIAAALRRATVMDERTSAAAVDSLTGLANRSAFLAALEHAIKLAVDEAEPADGVEPVAAVLYLDLDRFKPINDTYGHAAGDEVLRQVGKRLRSVCPDCDIVARIGGDEFALLLTSPSRPRILELSDELMTRVRKPIVTHAGVVSVGVSCGIAVVGVRTSRSPCWPAPMQRCTPDKRAKCG